jgi:hypothetical protein
LKNADVGAPYVFFREMFQLIHKNKWICSEEALIGHWWYLPDVLPMRTFSPYVPCLLPLLLK